LILLASTAIAIASKTGGYLCVWQYWVAAIARCESGGGLPYILYIYPRPTSLISSPAEIRAILKLDMSNSMLLED
jgi:hypothetical protein